MENNTEKANEPKLEYQTPEIKHFGSVAELTQGVSSAVR